LATLLGLVLAGLAVVVAALVVHYWFVLPHRQDQARRQMGVALQPVRPASRPGAAAGPLELTTQPWVASGLERLAQPPADAKAPQGAQFLFAARQALPEGAADNVNYLTAQEPAAVEAFYRTAMEAAGYKLVPKTPASRPAGTTELLYLRDDQDYYRISLRPVDNGKTRIALVISRFGKK
jgi:hypothetical protein